MSMFEKDYPKTNRPAPPPAMKPQGHQPEKVDSRPKVPEGLSSGAKKTFGCDGDRSICTNNGCSNCLKGYEYFSPHKVISFEEMKNLGGIIEFMAVNPNVDSFVREKEARIEKLEKQNEEMKEHIRALEAHLFGVHYCNCDRIEEEESK